MLLRTLQTGFLNQGKGLPFPLPPFDILRSFQNLLEVRLCYVHTVWIWFWIGLLREVTEKNIGRSETVCRFVTVCCLASSTVSVCKPIQGRLIHDKQQTEQQATEGHKNYKYIYIYIHTHFNFSHSTTILLVYILFIIYNIQATSFGFLPSSGPL